MAGAAVLGSGAFRPPATGGAPKMRIAAPAGQSTTDSALVDLLGVVPDPGIAPDPGEVVDLPANLTLATFADSAAQLAATGVAPPLSQDDIDAFSFWSWATGWLPFPVGIPGYVELVAKLGLDATLIDQSLQVGAGPNAVALLRGRFDRDTLAAGWAQAGYQPTDVPDALAYTWSETGDPTIDAHMRSTQALLTNVAVLADGTVLAAQRLDRLHAAVDAAAGRAPALLARPAVATLVAAAPPGLAGAYLAPGTVLRHPLVEPTGDMPPVELVLVGVTAGGPLPFERRNEQGTPIPFRDDTPPARLVLALLVADEATAAAAVPAIEAGLTTGQSQSVRAPYRDLFAAWTVEQVSGVPVVLVAITFRPDRSPALWERLYHGRDLGFVAW
jgi:hypothetical protein